MYWFCFIYFFYTVLPWNASAKDIRKVDKNKKKYSKKEETKKNKKKTASAKKMSRYKNMKNLLFTFIHRAFLRYNIAINEWTLHHFSAQYFWAHGAVALCIYVPLYSWCDDGEKKLHEAKQNKRKQRKWINK